MQREMKMGCMDVRTWQHACMRDRAAATYELHIRRGQGPTLGARGTCDPPRASSCRPQKRDAEFRSTVKLVRP